ncbi:MAG: putative selenium-dependent hydroxylase accessory protein YqeC [Deltaproteobacteria bacterium]|nr:putative selenium-dependent hydroxylase accessory protein YqeC [Deltaproteobacteria bacterium]
MNHQTDTGLLTLQGSLGVKKGDIISLIGGGGKTTTMYNLANELAISGLKVIVTTTTHIAPPEDPSYSLIFTKEINEVASALEMSSLVIVADRFENEKLCGIDPVWVNDLSRLADVIIVEADGAKNRPFKAPHEHEPVIPASSTMVIPVVGIEAAYKPLSEEWAHRIERISLVTGLKPGETITPEVIAKTLLHPMGGMKGVPSDAEFIPLINKADSRDSIRTAREVSLCLFDGGVKKTIITSHKYRKFIKPFPRNGHVTAVILAAGGSSRMGKPKQLLEIGGKTLVSIVIENILASIADEVVIVTQPDLPLISDNEYPEIKRVINKEWQTGQSSSMKAGLRAIDKRSDAVMFFMADQPMVDTATINRLIIAFQENEKPIISPLYNGKKGAPVLFKRGLFNELSLIQGDRGGRGLLETFPVEYVDIDRPGAGMDVDTPEEFNRLKALLDVPEK